MDLKESNESTDGKEMIEIETYTKEGKVIPKDRHYKIRIDNEKYIVDKDEMNGRQLLQLANKTPIEWFAIFQRLKGGQTHKIEFDEVVSFLTPGIERFMTLPIDQTEG